MLSGAKYCVLADYASVTECQEKVSQAYDDQGKWERMALLNVARSRKFSSDRAISEYAKISGILQLLIFSAANR